MKKSSTCRYLYARYWNHSYQATTASRSIGCLLSCGQFGVPAGQFGIEEVSAKCVVIAGPARPSCFPRRWSLIMHSTHPCMICMCSHHRYPLIIKLRFTDKTYCRDLYDHRSCISCTTVPLSDSVWCHSSPLRYFYHTMQVPYAIYTFAYGYHSVGGPTGTSRLTQHQPLPVQNRNN